MTAPTTHLKRETEKREPLVLSQRERSRRGNPTGKRMAINQKKKKKISNNKKRRHRKNMAAFMKQT